MGRTAVPPTPLHRTSVSPRTLPGTLSFRRRVFAGNPHHRRGLPGPQAAPPEKHHEHRFAQHPHSKIQRADVRLWGGYLKKIEHHEHRFAQHPLSKIQRTDVKLLGGYVKQNKGAHHEHQQTLEAEKPATKRPRSYMEGPRGGKASCKKSKKMYMVAASPKRGGGGRARPPAPLPGGGALCACGILSIYHISIYLYLLIYPSIYIIHISYNIYIYIYTSLSLSLFLSRSCFWRGFRRAHVCATKLQF